MFTEFANQVWTNSVTGVTITNNTDTSIDGSSKKIVWTELGGTVTVTFDSVLLTAYEEVSFHLFVRDTLSTDLFTLTIGGTVTTFSRTDFKSGRWNHVLLDCALLTTPATTIVFTSLVADLTIFFDYPGYRSVSYNSDIDVITALKNHINLDYDVSTTLTAAATAGDNQVYIDTSNIVDYVADNSVLELNDGAGTTELVYLINRTGLTHDSLVNSFSNGSTVEIVCPVRSEDYDDIQPDPICGIKVFDLKVDRQPTIMHFKGGSKIKEYLGALGVLIYIDCKSKKKLLQMSREYNRKYGKEFQFLLDGEQVEIFMDSSTFVDDVIGNNPRMAYYYYIEPQPYLLIDASQMSTITLTTEVTVSE